MDSIRILDLPVRAHIGVPEAERDFLQELRVDAELSFDIRAAAAGDDFSKTIDYAAVCKLILAVGMKRERRLVETLAEEMAAEILAEFPAEAVRLLVRKPSALRSFGAAAAAVEVYRSRHG
ncbi:MAG: dihydroneopterin aldolase [Acidobacteria bacterium]|nr:dihydroneopterin aldolase [Acidobacteriota bacterium]